MKFGHSQEFNTGQMDIKRIFQCALIFNIFSANDQASPGTLVHASTDTDLMWFSPKVNIVKLLDKATP